MRSSWEAQHAAFVRSIMTLQADRQFQRAAAHHPALARFDSPRGLVAHLTAIDGDLDEKDAIYAALVAAVQAQEDWAALATAILWCGLWPALDAIHGRRFHHFEHEPDEFVAVLSHAFTALVARLALGRVQRVAATLVRNTERWLMAERWRSWAYQARHAAPTATLATEAHFPATPATSGLSFAGETRALRGWLWPVLGADTDLLLTVIVLEASQREAGEPLGLSHEATRKRVQRALACVRDHLMKQRAAPGLAAPPRVAADRTLAIT